jgi:glycine oxidase
MAWVTPSVTVVGAGVAGLCVATELAARGRAVRLVDRGGGPGPHGCSWWAGGMLAPFCEGERAEEPVVRLGRSAADWWERHAGGVTRAGTLVVALGRDRAELDRFARRTEGHKTLGADRIGELEPDLEGRFGRALFFTDEAHLDPRRALATLVERLAGRGVVIEAGDGPGGVPPRHRAATRAEGGARARRADPGGSAGLAFPTENEQRAVAGPSDLPPPPSWGRDGEGGTMSAPPTVVDCRGLAAQDALRDLRGVKGEMVVLRCPEVRLGRPVRLLHPRAPLYIVPRGDGVYMLGATVIETAERGRVTARSMLELLSAAYALHPAFGEAEVLEIGVDARPAFPDNLPRIRRLGGTIHANGLFRHGFLLGPALAAQVADLLFDGKTPEFSDEHHAERGAA